MLISILLAFGVVCACFFGKTFAKARKVFVPLLAFSTFLSIAINAYKFYNGFDFGTFALSFGLFTLNFGVDGNGFAFALLISGLWGIATIYSFSYLETNYPEKNDALFQICYSLAVFIAIAFAFAKDIVTIFILYEFLTISTIALVGFKKNEESKIGVFKYVSILFGCSLLMLLPATLFIVNTVGIKLFDGSGFMEASGIDPFTLKILLAFLIFGVGKAAFFPFHVWLPFAMCAPTPVSGLLHAVAVVKVGAFFVLRVINDIYGINFLKILLEDFNFLMYLASFTIVFASVTALFQSNLKKRLAFSTVSQISYVLLALSTFTKTGVFAAMFHIVAHAVTKILLFFTVGGFYTSAHSNQIIAFKGMVQKNRLACFAFLLAALSVCGLPFTVGFLDKALLFYTLANSKQYIGMGALFISAFLSFCYLIPVGYAIFSKIPPRKVDIKFISLPRAFKIVFLILAILNIILFFIGSLFFLIYVNGR
jgi:multicomponent Na+:H+ antiporter subunit D